MANVAFVGLAGTGKTTYLAALWNSLQETTGDHSLELVTFPHDAVYLQSIHQSWIKGEPVGHTSRDGGEHVHLDVKHSDQELTLDVPDLSGESFEDMVVSRQLDTLVDGILTSATGVVIFAHPDHLRPRITIAQARRMGAIGVDVASSAPVPPQDRTKLPSELHAVDLLQAMSLRCVHQGVPQHSRVSVILSAWDLIRAEGNTPAQWMEHRMPMLHYFLNSTLGSDFRIFGVSAQGGPTGAQMASSDPATKARVVESNGLEHGDIAAPILWAAHLT
jgi:hypothetical protein